MLKVLKFGLIIPNITYNYKVGHVKKQKDSKRNLMNTQKEFKKQIRSQLEGLPTCKEVVLSVTISE